MPDSEVEVLAALDVVQTRRPRRGRTPPAGAGRSAERAGRARSPRTVMRGSSCTHRMRTTCDRSRVRATSARPRQRRARASASAAVDDHHVADAACSGVRARPQLGDHPPLPCPSRSAVAASTARAARSSRPARRARRVSAGDHQPSRAERRARCAASVSALTLSSRPVARQRRCTRRPARTRVEQVGQQRGSAVATGIADQPEIDRAPSDRRGCGGAALDRPQPASAPVRPTGLHAGRAQRRHQARVDRAGEHRDDDVERRLRR